MAQAYAFGAEDTGRNVPMSPAYPQDIGRVTAPETKMLREPARRPAPKKPPTLKKKPPRPRKPRNQNIFGTL